MANMHRKRCPASLAIREAYSKAMMDHLYTPVGINKFFKVMITQNAGKDAAKWTLSYFASGNIK